MNWFCNDVGVHSQVSQMILVHKPTLLGHAHTTWQKNLDVASVSFVQWPSWNPTGRSWPYWFKRNTLQVCSHGLNKTAQLCHWDGGAVVGSDSTEVFGNSARWWAKFLAKESQFGTGLTYRLFRFSAYKMRFSMWLFKLKALSLFKLLFLISVEIGAWMSIQEWKWGLNEQLRPQTPQKAGAWMNAKPEPK